jgi:hypothetical protein
MITWHCMLLDDGKFVPKIVGDKSLIYIYIILWIWFVQLIAYIDLFSNFRNGSFCHWKVPTKVPEEHIFARRTKVLCRSVNVDDTLTDHMVSQNVDLHWCDSPVVLLSFQITAHAGCKNFPIFRNHLKILGARQMM